MNFFSVSRVAIGAAVLGAVVIAPLAAMAHIGKDYDSAGAHLAGSQLSVQINDNGNATIRGAKISSISGGTLVASTSFGSTSVSWTITTDASTKFLDKGGRTSSLAQMHVGDIVSFSGSIDPNASTLTVRATVLKDWSIDSKILQQHTFEGKLKSALGTTTLPTSFTLTIGGSTYTVVVPLNTPILSKNWASTNLSIFQVNDMVRVYGSVQAANLTTIDAVVVRNASR